MAALHNVGADAPGTAAPERTTNDEPRELAGGAGSKGKDRRGSLDCAEAARLAQSLLRELPRPAAVGAIMAAVGAIMVAAALAFAVAVEGRQ